MDKKEAKRVLVAALGGLNTEEKARLLRHAEKGTPICCGEEKARFYWIDGAG